ncbi:hypothetical protein AAFF_G00157420 [Aldrovandia affinis]|uniref:G-protein coupled receptors family 1 profile domain-containing protein n=1 Tax=Aldrovandia affinis TaxID=143900 RepID=A0AAD7RNJ6_9TELE|nr:hypothetical protein AAFF_G00157420 [Aldrovandia affinis]
MANCAMLSFTSCVGVAANALVIWAVIRQKSLQTSSNALVVNLAVVDLLRSAVDCPLLLSVLLRGRGALGPGVSMLCDAQMLSFSFGCCLQLLTLASIGAERYRAIASPFEARQQRRRRVMVWIPLTWTVASVLTAVCMARARDAPVYVKCRGLRADAMPVYNTFGRYILIPVWCGCFASSRGSTAAYFA